MRNKILILIIFFLFSSNIFPEDYLGNFVHMHYEDCYFFYSENREVHFLDLINKKDINLNSSIKRNSNGFYELEWTYKNIYPEPKNGNIYNIICGSNYLFFLRDKKEKNFKYMNEDYKKYSIFDFDIVGEYYLEETINNSQLSYSPENLRFKFSSMYDLKNDYQSGTLPWAVNKNKLKEAYCEIKYKKNIKGLVFLNGYVDTEKQSLYFKNARARDVMIIDNNSNKEITITLVDDLIFQDVILPFETDNIRIELLTYYPGNKYDDICISAIYPCYVYSRDYVYSLEEIRK